MERRSRKRSSSAGSEKIDRVGDRFLKGKYLEEYMVLNMKSRTNRELEELSKEKI